MNRSSPSASTPTRVVIIDDHRAIVEMIAQVIDAMPGFRVVGSAGSTDDAIQVIEQTAPEVIVLDLVLNPGSGVSVLRHFATKERSIRSLIFSGNLRLPLVREALASGALGMLDKGASLAEFRRALSQVAAGQPYFGGEAGTLVRELVQRRGHADRAAVELTDREQDVLRLLASGLSSKEIADRLSLSVHTVVNHRSKLMRKTGLHRVAQLSRYAAELGLIEEPSPATSTE